MKRNKNGFSMIYVLAALLLTGFISVSLIELGQSDRISSIFYSSSESARITASSGIMAATSRIGSADSATISEILVLINKYVAADNPDTLADQYLWVKGSASTWDSLTPTQKYRVKIVGFQPQTFEVSLQIDAIGRGGSRASAVAIYDLKGLMWNTTVNSGNTPTNALQMDNGAFEFDVPLVVNGNTSLKKGMKIWDPAVFHGSLRCDTLVNPDGTKEIGVIEFSSGQLEVDSIAYFAGQIGGGGANALFHSNVGFNGMFYFQNSNVTFDASGSSRYIFAGGANDAGCGAVFDMQNNELEVYNTSKTYDPNNNISSFTNFNNSWPSISNSSVDVASKVGFTTPVPPKIYFDTSALTTIHATIDAASNWGNGPGLTGDSLNAIFAASAGSRVGGFAIARVINTNTASGIFNNDGSVFTGKLILWVDDARNIESDYVETSSSANLSMYVKNGSGRNPHFNNFNYARGYIYLNDYSADNFAFGGNGGNCEIDGGVYSSENTKLFFHGSGVQTITYDATVISELAALGIFNNPDDSSSSSTATNTNIVLDSSATKISLELLGQYM